MNEKETAAIRAYSKGYTCSQAVMSAYAEDMGIDGQALYKMMEGFGGGMGGMQEVCGALSAAFAVISFYHSDGKLDEGKSKAQTYKIIREAAEMFREKCGAIRCYDILHGDKPKPFKCGDKVRIAVEVAEHFVADRRN